MIYSLKQSLYVCIPYIHTEKNMAKFLIYYPRLTLRWRTILKIYIHTHRERRIQGILFFLFFQKSSLLLFFHFHFFFQLYPRKCKTKKILHVLYICCHIFLAAKKKDPQKQEKQLILGLENVDPHHQYYEWIKKKKMFEETNKQGLLSDDDGLVWCLMFGLVGSKIKNNVNKALSLYKFLFLVWWLMVGFTFFSFRKKFLDFKVKNIHWDKVTMMNKEKHRSFLQKEKKMSTFP